MLSKHLKPAAYKSVVLFGELLGIFLRIGPEWSQDGFTRMMLRASSIKPTARLATVIGYNACRAIYRGAQGRELVKTIELPGGHGSIRCNVCDKTPSGLAFNGDHEPEIREILLRFQQPGSVAIDAGSHVGIHSVPLALSAQQSGGMVICFEPFDRVRHFLRENIRLNDVEDVVRVYECALSNHESEETFHINPWNDGGGSTIETGVAADGAKIVPLNKLKYSGLTLKIQTRRLDDVATEIMEDSRISRSVVSIVKVDVEGGELAVIEGAKALISGENTVYHPAWLVEMSRDVHKTFETFMGEGYVCMSAVDSMVIDDPDTIRMGSNMIFIHPDHPAYAK